MYNTTPETSNESICTNRPPIKHTPRTRPRLDQTQSAGMVPVYPHAPTFLGPESPAGVPTPPLQILPPARDPWGGDPHIP